jgi:DNA-binding transcriptional MerR regulator
MRNKNHRELPKDWRIQTQEILCQQDIQMDVEKIRNVLRSPNPDPDQFKAVVKAMQKVKAKYRRKLITVERLKQQAKKR